MNGSSQDTVSLNSDLFSGLPITCRVIFHLALLASHYVQPLLWASESKSVKLLGFLERLFNSAFTILCLLDYLVDESIASLTSEHFLELRPGVYFLVCLRGILFFDELVVLSLPVGYLVDMRGNVKLVLLRSMLHFERVSRCSMIIRAEVS